MILDRLLNQNGMPSLEQWLKFTDERAKVIGEDVVNVSTPGYVQKDLSLNDFQKALAAHQEAASSAAPGSIDFDDISMDVQHPKSGILFHDRNNRSMEQLITDQAKNALMHNLAVELLRQQFATLDMALKEKVG